MLDIGDTLCYYIIVTRKQAQQEGERKMEEEMTTIEFKTIIEMVIEVIKSSRDKEEALEKLQNLSILKD